jgi:hypothetical protein
MLVCSIQTETQTHIGVLTAVDGSDRFKSVGICGAVSLLAHDMEAPATKGFLDGYSVGTVSTAIIENMLHECGNEELTVVQKQTAAPQPVHGF